MGLVFSCQFLVFSERRAYGVVGWCICCTTGVGCMPVFGWEQSGGESMPAVAGIVYRFLEKRRAGTRARSECRSVVCGGLAGRGLAGHLRSGTCYEYRHPVDEACCRRGGVAGAEPPHKGGPTRPDRPELQ